MHTIKYATLGVEAWQSHGELVRRLMATLEDFRSLTKKEFTKYISVVNDKLIMLLCTWTFIMNKRKNSLPMSCMPQSRRMIGLGTRHTSHTTKA